MKKLLLTASFAALSVVFSQGILAGNHTSSNLLKSSQKDLVQACVRTQSGQRACGYFSRNTLMKLAKKNKKDIDCYVMCF